MTNSISSADPAVRSLLQDIRQSFGHPLSALNDFLNLSLDVERVTRQHLSEDTLRRLYGARNDTYSTVRLSTLDILSQYAGCADWKEYVAALSRRTGAESEQTRHAGAVYASDLEEGREVSIGWQPDRRCVLRYCGNMQWEVLDVENSHTLQAGDRFLCSSFASGRTVLADRLTRHGEELGGVSIGTVHGLAYVRVEDGK